MKNTGFSYCPIFDAIALVTELSNLTEDFNQLITTVNTQEAELEKLVLTDDLYQLH
ncbi:MAG: hypothetical protein ACI9FJ_002392 [Alteromonadaceae bacterium]|jgi:hypothetical protein